MRGNTEPDRFLSLQSLWSLMSLVYSTHVQ